MAIGCLEAARDLGRSVPSNLSVVGHNDVAIASCSRPALTSVRPANYEMGKRAVEFLMDRTDADAVGERKVRVAGELVARKSVALRQPAAAGPVN
jgi:LacI family transcriptional regulator